MKYKIVLIGLWCSLGLASHFYIPLKGESLYKLAAEGYLDPEFGEGGLLHVSSLRTDVGKVSWWLKSQSSKGFYLTGTLFPPYPDGREVICRKSEMGKLDTSFGGVGWVDAPHVPDDRVDYVFEGTGGLLRCGTHFTGNGKPPGFTCRRVFPDGKVDAEFGESGILKYDFVSLLPALCSGHLIMRFDQAERIVTYFMPYQRNGDAFPELIRFLPNGKLDPSFGENGVVVGSPASELLELSSGKHLLWGTRGTRSFIARKLISGEPDSSFGNRGEILFSDPLGDVRLYQVVEDSQGRLYVAYGMPNDKVIVVGRYDTKGQRDNTFTDASLRFEVNFSDWEPPGVFSIWLKAEHILVFYSPLSRRVPFCGRRLSLEEGILDKSYGVRGEYCTGW